MSIIKFEWDEKKNRANKKKHGISFEEAQTIFSDENGLLIHDPDHSEDEGRYILLGFSINIRLLVVCHCYRSSEEVVRIFSARKAEKDEEKQYWKR